MVVEDDPLLLPIEPLLVLGEDVEPDELELGRLDELELLLLGVELLGEDVLPEAPLDLPK